MVLFLWQNAQTCNGRFFWPSNRVVNLETWSPGRSNLPTVCSFLLFLRLRLPPPPPPPPAGALAAARFFPGLPGDFAADGGEQSKVGVGLQYRLRWWCFQQPVTMLCRLIRYYLLRRCLWGGRLVANRPVRGHAVLSHCRFRNLGIIDPLLHQKKTARHQHCKKKRREKREEKKEKRREEALSPCCIHGSTSGSCQVQQCSPFNIILVCGNPLRPLFSTSISVNWCSNARSNLANKVESGFTFYPAFFGSLFCCWNW